MKYSSGDQDPASAAQNGRQESLQTQSGLQKPGVLKITSEPALSEVKLDGDFNGLTPRSKALKPGDTVQLTARIHNRTDDYVHGELFPTMGMTAVPDNPRGIRSKSIEKRCKVKGQWNKYVVVAVDGTVKLSVNGKFVNGLSKSERKKGYICLEAEGAEIHFRNIRIMELPPGVTSPEQTAPLVE